MTTHNCETCPAHAHLAQMGLKVDSFDRVIALAGNPNTGKSTLFNALTGLKQHTGNWPGKTVTRAEGGFQFNNVRYKLVDLPGTYSLLSASADEEVARDFLLFGTPDCTIVVADGTALERNLNLVLQVLEITGKVVVAINLMDEASAQGHRSRCAQPVARSRRSRRAGRRAHRRRDVMRCSRRSRASSRERFRPSRCRLEGTQEFNAAIAELVPSDRGDRAGRAERAVDCDPAARRRRQGRAGAPHGRARRAGRQAAAARRSIFSPRLRFRGHSEHRQQGVAASGHRPARCQSRDAGS